MGQQVPQVAVAPLADAPEPTASATGVLPRRQSEPARELAPALEGMDVTDGADQGSRRQRPDTGHRQQPFADGVEGEKRFRSGDGEGATDPDGESY